MEHTRPTGHVGPGGVGLPKFLPVTGRFDGKPIGLELAQKLAGDETLAAWGNCSFYMTSQGQAIIPTQETNRSWGTKVACVYVGTTTDAAAHEYYFTDRKCSRGAECKNGYTLIVEADSTIAFPGGSNKSEYTFDRVFSGRAPRTTPLVSNRRGRHPRRGAHVPRLTFTRFKKQFEIVGRMVLEPSPYEMVQVYDGRGKKIGDPVTEYLPIASTASGGGPCQALFNFLTNKVSGVAATVGTVSLGINIGAGIVFLAYYGLAYAGVEGDILGKAFTISGLVGLWSNAKSLLGDLRDLIHSTYQWEAEHMKSVICGSGPRPHGPIHQPHPNTPKAPELQPNSCLDCSAYDFGPSWSYTDPNTGTYTVHGGEMECDGPTYAVQGGTDTNGDGICDGGVLEMVTEYNAKHGHHP